ncbi:MAG: hypothetical protein P8Y80_13465 [Acidobacteriota bacterium]
MVAGIRPEVSFAYSAFPTARCGAKSIIGVGIAIAVGIDIDPDSDTDSDIECGGLLNDDKNVTLQVRHTRDHSLQTPGSVKPLLPPRPSRRISQRISMAKM